MFDPLAGVVFFGTLSGYSFLRLRKPFFYPDSLSFLSQNLQWKIIAILGFIAVLIFTIQLSGTLRLFVLFAGVLTGLYSFFLPIYKRRIRNIPLLKIFLISITWTWVTVLLPWASIQDNIAHIPWPDILIRFAFIFAITLPFDYRDREIDQSEDTLTIPGWLGWHTSRAIAYLLLLLCMGLEIIPFDSIGHMTIMSMAYCLTYLLAIVLIAFVNPSRSARYYAFGIDGLMIAPLFLHWVLFKIG